MNSRNGDGPAVAQLTGAELWTIGEADHDSDQLIDLLAARGINRLVDVRHTPMSPRSPDYSIRTLPSILAMRTIVYEYMGDALGGQPRGRWEYLQGREISTTGRWR